MAQLADFLVNWPLEKVLMITLLAMGFLALAGWVISDAVSIGRLLLSVRKATTQIHQIWRKDQLDNLKQLRELAGTQALGYFSDPIRLAILTDLSNQPVALADPKSSLDTKKLIRQAPGRFWGVPAFALMIITGVVGFVLAIFIQLVSNPYEIAASIILYSIMAVLVIGLYRTIDMLFVHLLTVQIEQLQDLLSHHFPIYNDIQIQHQLLISQRQLSVQLKLVSPELNAALTDTVQKNWVPAVKNMSQSFEEALKHLHEEQQHGMGKLAAHFARQLDQSLGEHLTAMTASIDKINALHEAGSARAFALLNQLDQSHALQTSAHDQTTRLISDLSAAQRDLTDSGQQLQAIMQKGSEQLQNTYLESAGHLNDVLRQSGEMTQEISLLLVNGQAEAARVREEQAETENRISGYFDLMRLQINQLQDGLQANLVDIFSKFTDLTSMTLSQTDEHSQQMISNLTEQSTQLMNTLDNQVRELSFLVRDVASEISGLSQNLDSSVTQLNDQLNATTQQVFTSFDIGLKGLVDQLSQTIEEIHDAVDDLPAAVVSLRDWFESSPVSHESRGR